MTQLGFLGLGNMGQAIAGRMLAAGFPVTVWNRTATAGDELVAAGATRAQTPAEALAAPVSFSMLADDRAADAVLSADALGDGPAGRIHVNMASISPAAAQALADRFAQAGIAYISAPVLGRPPVAAAGKLNILTAGPADAVATVDEYLATCSVRRWPFGERARDANSVKVAMNYLILQSLQALGESITLVEAQGVDAGAFVDLLSNSLFGGVVHSGYGGMMARREYRPAGFRMPLGLKDLSLAEQLADEAAIPLPTAPVLRAAFDEALTDPELAESDWAAVAEVMRRRAS